MAIDYIKRYCNITQEVTIYDDKLEAFRLEAIDYLEKAGCSRDEKKPLVRSYISTYCRMMNVSEPSEQWRQAEMRRLQHILETLYFGDEE